jgi:WD40 repeat protein
LITTRRITEIDDEIRGGGVVSIKDVDVSNQVDDPWPPDEMRYDVFLSYNSGDRAVVRNVARRLREARVRVWFDEDSSTRGGDWQDDLSAGLRDSGACAIFIGAQKMSGWVDREMKVALDRETKDRGFRVFPVLLPEAGPVFHASQLPPFLSTKQWVNLRDGPESARAMQSLVNAIHGVASPERGTVANPGECPYRGLKAFEEEHARFFFGRGAQVQRLIEEMRQSRFVAVIGQSGVGKSSLAQAGLLPELKAGALPGSAGWRTVVIRPGAHPAESLAAKIVALHGEGMNDTVDRLAIDERTLHLAARLAVDDGPADGKLLVLVDQFEEIFTLCTDPDERAAFVQNLIYSATIPRGSTVVVLTMRADFYPQMTQFAAFAQLVQSHHLHVPPLGDAELREVIQEPAYRAGLQVEQGLTDTILADIERRPGNLPLLQHALRETWEKRHGTMLTLAGYRETGGVRHALGERGEAVYEDLPDAEKAAAKNLFLRLVQPGEGTEDTRRRVALPELSADTDRVVAEAIRHFVHARLLTITTDDAGERWIEISHEAVITGWARCARWVDEDRAGLLVHRRLTVAAEEWQRLDRSRHALYRGVTLVEARKWRARSGDRLNTLERDFLDAGKAQDRWRKVTAVIGVISFLVVGVAGIAAWQEQALAASRLLAFQADSVLDVDPSLSLALALRAMEVADTELAEQVLRQATATSHGRSVIKTSGGSVHGLRLLPDGRVVSGSADGGVRIWNRGDDARPREIAWHDEGVNAVRVGPDGTTVASAGVDRTVRITDLVTTRSSVVLMAPAVVSNIEFNHRGDQLAATLLDGNVHLIDLRPDGSTAVRPTGTRVAYAASFSSDDSMLATANADGTAQIFSLPDMTPRRTLRQEGAIEMLDFSPSARRLATTGADGTVRIWDTDTGGVEEIAVSGAPLWYARFSPDGDHLAAAGQDGAVHVVTTEGRPEATYRGHGGGVLELDFDSTGSTVVSAGLDGTIRTWALEEDVHLPDPVTTATFDRDATNIVSGGADGRLRMWRRDDLVLVHDMEDHAGYSYAVFSTDGSRIISFGMDKAVNIRNSVTGKMLRSFPPDVGGIMSVQSDAADRRLVIGGLNGRVVVADYDGAELETLQDSGSPVYTVSFSPDGRSVLAGRADGSVTLWGPDRRPVTIRPADLQAVYDVAFHPNGSLLATADSTGGIALWDTLGRNAAPLRGHDGPASALQFRGDGKQLFSSGADGTVRVWDVTSRRLLMTFEEGDGSVNYVDVSSDGRTILQSSENGRARMFSCAVCESVDAVITLARPRAFRVLTPEEERRFSLSD